MSDRTVDEDGPPEPDAIDLGGTLTIPDVVSIARGARARLDDGARARIEASRAVVERAVSSGKIVYGVTTGFGALADVQLGPEDAVRLQHSLLRTHAVAVGPELSREEVRAMLGLRAHVLGLGYSGVRLEGGQRFVDMLQFGILP